MVKATETAEKVVKATEKVVKTGKVAKTDKVFTLSGGKELLKEEGKKANFNYHTEMICMGITALKAKGKDKYTLSDLEKEVLSIFPYFFNKPSSIPADKRNLESFKVPYQKSTQTFKSIFSVWRSVLKENNWID